MRTSLSILGIALVLVLGTACSSDPASPITPGTTGLSLTTFDLKVGDKLVFQSTEVSFGETTVEVDTITVTTLTGTSGAQYLAFDEGLSYRMDRGILQYLSAFGLSPVAKFPSKNGDTIATGLDTLSTSGDIDQIYARLLTTSVADTTVRSAGQNIRCGVFVFQSAPLIEDGTAPVSQITAYAVSPSLGIIGSYTQGWAGASTSGPPFSEETIELIAIIRK
jgi:hypothetical protein